MSMTRYEADEWVDALHIAAAAERSLHRSGTSQDREAERRSEMKTMTYSARALSIALNKFAESIAKHTDGVHCTASVNAEVAALRTALGDFAFAVEQAGTNGHVVAPSPDVEVPLPIAPSQQEPHVLDALHANWLPLRLPRGTGGSSEEMTM